ncbi:MAG: serine/threonine-protein phosphatase [Candidatus Altiarchaeales archaeon HGW-Altiarchaeales-1]|nr:MAG: serine/threonine-protein phosphatase [Candidatus Altiarchaeales archaeon HGW-Altiarchaeales-1]
MENNIYNIIYSGKTEKGMKENNEDDYVTISYERNNENKDKIYLLAVADGLGGHASGELASKIAIMELRETIKRNLEVMDVKNTITTEMLKDLLLSGFKKASDEILYQAKIMPGKKGMCTTMVAALVKENGECVIANVGDSRAYLIGDKSQIWHTKDHSYVQLLVDIGEITEEEAFSHSMKNLVEKVLGLEENIKPDLYEKKIEDEILLLSSDGLHDFIRDGEIKDIVLKQGISAADMLIEKALENESYDNITVVLAGKKQEKENNI